MSKKISTRKNSQRHLDPKVEAQFGARLRVARELAKMSQSDLGTHLGVTFQQIQKFEKGTNRISASRIVKISEILDIDVRYLLGIQVDSQPDMLPLSRNEIKLLAAIRKIENKDALAKTTDLLASIALQ